MSTNEKHPDPKHQFSLRSLLLLVAYYGITFAVARFLPAAWKPLHDVVPWFLFVWLLPVFVWLGPVILIRLFFLCALVGIPLDIIKSLGVIPNPFEFQHWIDNIGMSILFAVIVGLIISLRVHGPSDRFFYDLGNAFSRAFWRRQSRA